MRLKVRYVNVCWAEARMGFPGRDTAAADKAEKWRGNIFYQGQRRQKCYRHITGMN